MNYITEFIVYIDEAPYYGNDLRDLLPEGVYDFMEQGYIFPNIRIKRYNNQINDYELFNIV